MHQYRLIRGITAVMLFAIAIAYSPTYAASPTDKNTTTTGTTLSAPAPSVTASKFVNWSDQTVSAGAEHVTLGVFTLTATDRIDNNIVDVALPKGATGNIGNMVLYSFDGKQIGTQLGGVIQTPGARNSYMLEKLRFTGAESYTIAIVGDMSKKAHGAFALSIETMPAGIGSQTVARAPNPVILQKIDVVEGTKTAAADPIRSP